MPFGPYGSFDDCVSKNGDKGNPEAFCAWLEHKITKAWPGQMSTDKYPEVFWTAYDAALSSKKEDAVALQEATAAAEAAGYSLTRFGWVKEFQSPNMKTITGVRVFGTGTWTDSAGFERTWTEDDLDNMIAAFTAGVPAVVPIKCGHTSDAFNRRIAEALGVPVENVTGDHGQGQIALGRMAALERKGSWNIASFDKVPEPIANLIEGGQYSTVSVEIEDTVGDYGPVITGVALLGAEEPAVEGATLGRALVFGGSRTGARVWSFQVGDDIPLSELRAEFDDIRGKLAEIVKGKRGAPIFRALFGNLSELFERLSGGQHAAPEDRANNQANEKTNKGGKLQMPEELKAIAQALGLGEEATLEDIIAAIKALAEKTAAPPAEEAEAAAKAAAAKEGEGELAAELKKANDEIGDLKKRLDGQSSLAAWKEKTAKFTAIPGTPVEHATSLSDIEGKAGKEAAESQFKALEAANNLAAEALKVVGSSRTNGPTDFDNEIAKYMTDHKDATKVQAIDAVSKSHPELYFARRDGWDQ